MTKRLVRVRKTDWVEELAETAEPTALALRISRPPLAKDDRKPSVVAYCAPGVDGAAFAAALRELAGELEAVA